MKSGDFNILEPSRLVQVITEIALPSLLFPQYCYNQQLYDVSRRYCKNHVSQYFFVGVREQVQYARPST